MLKNKKGMAFSVIITLLILLISFFFIGTFILQSKEIAENVITDDIAREYVKVKCGIKEGTANLLSLPTIYMTKHKMIPETGETKEDFMQELGDLTYSCWYKFNDGGVCENLWEGFWSLGLGKKKCFICYTFDMKKLKDADKVTDTEFLYWMNTNLKLLEEEHDNCMRSGGFCVSNEETFRNNYEENKIYFKCEENNKKCKDVYGVDTEKNICCYSSRYTCLNRGGVCKEKSFINKLENKNKYKKYDKWFCPGDKECFVDTTNYYTYYDYIKGYGESGTVLFRNHLDFEPQSNIYAIAFTNKINIDWAKALSYATIPMGGAIFFSQLKEEDLPYEIPTIVISRLDELKEYCNIQRDIKGR